MVEVPNKEVFCSFCGRSNHDVELVIAGQTGIICNECVEVCVGNILEERPGLLGEKSETVAQLANLKYLLNQAVGAIGAIVLEEKKKIQPLEKLLGDIHKSLNPTGTEDSDSS